MSILAIDLETYSELDIKKVGLYKYAENSEILLFAYAFDDEPVQVVDIIGGEPLPFEVIEALQNEDVMKVAYNAAFERVVLNYHYPTIGIGEPSQWFCTMVQGFTLGLPGGLDKVGKALGIEEDKQKLATGKKLIQYFSKPCRPTKVNGGRTRNRPQHDTEKWAMFKEYCRQDVEAERAIRKKLEKFWPIPSERQLWALDQRINDNGVLLDNDVIDGALQIDIEMKYQLTNEVIKLTGVENPNSLPQITGWIRQKQPELKFDTFDKASRAELLKRDDLLPEVRKVIEIKNLLSKTSCKKYQAMKDMRCSDGRVHGMLQFYGASRTGRWCLTGDHEVLTDSGWVRLDEWKGGKIACWNHTNEIVSFGIAKQVAFDYEGEMYSIKTQRCEQLSTPDHKMPHLDKEGVWRSDVISKVASKRFCIPFYGYKASNANSVDSNMLRVLIMTQADGHYTEDGVRYHFKKKRKVDRCKMLLRKAEIPFSVRHNGDGSTVFYVPRRHEPLPLRMFENKVFDMWLLNESADVVFDELRYWDCSSNSKNTVQYVTCNKNNADLIQALAVMSGRSATMLTKFRNNEKWSTAYVVNIWNNAGKSHTVRIENVGKENYRGKVYCAETKTGYFLVRRNGKVWVTGNSGRGVQVQNLPQNHLDDLDGARNVVKTANYEVLEQLYDSPADVLSQLIRTAFIAPANHRFIVADFSAIEARVIAWLADEKWRMQVFANGGDIYCASASQMFHVPVEKHGINGHLRQKGKVAELACIAEGELVLTDKGLVPIERVTTKHLVWDGSSWVRHEGVIYKGVREVIEYDGLTATADHIVYIKGDAATQGKPREIRFGEAASSRAHILQSGNGREAVWVCPHNLGRKALEQKDESLLCADPVCIVPKYSVDRTGEPEKGEVKRLSAMLSTETDTIVVRPKVYSRKTALRKSKRQGLSELWRKGYKIRVFKRNRSRLVPDEIISKDGPLNGNRQNRQQWELCSRKFADDKQEGKQLEQENHSAIRVPSKVLALQLQCGNSEVKTGTDKGGDNIRRLQSGNKKEKELANYCRKARVYDIRNAGPHHRFTVSGKLVHNCGYGGGVNALKAFGADKMGMTQQEMEATIKQWREASPHICKLWRSVEDSVKKAIRTKMVIVGDKGIKYKYYAPWLFIKLPSGRKLAYYKPRIEQEEGFGERITYEGVMLAGGWGRNYTWGGKLVENLVQGIARDCLAVSMLRLAKAGYKIVMHVHDEVILEEPYGTGSLENACAIMGQAIDWAPDLLLRADGYETEYYKKD